MSLKVNNINPFANGNIGGTNTVSQPFQQQTSGQSAGIDQSMFGQTAKVAQPQSTSFTSAVNAFNQKYSSGRPSVANARENYSNNLSNVKQGALGEDALYVQGGRAGGNLNFVI